MINKLFSLLIISLFCFCQVDAQRLSPEQYIELYKDFAIREMKRMGVPASITLAQGLLETENGNSVLVKKSNNHFGIKCKNNWTAGGVSHDDDAPGECFRTYKDAEDSYRDHSNFLRGSERYAFLFSLDPSNYKGWAHGLKKAGYATNPKYPNILIRHIERYNLQQYDLAAADDVPKFDKKNFRDDPVVADTELKMLTSYVDDKRTIPESNGSLNQDVLSNVTTEGKVTHVNNRKCVWAPKGTSLLVIATHHNISLKKLLDFNDLEEDGILETDQLIFLQKKSTTGKQPFYQVSQEETYYDVAQKNGVQLEYILEYNQVNEDENLKVGSKVYLQPVSESDQARDIREKTTTAQVYEVQPREGLYAVAKKHSVTVQQLKEWNNLTSDNLQVGQQLIVGK